MTGGAGAGGDLLATILGATRRIIEVRRQREPVLELARRADARDTRRGAFRRALERTGRINVVAECKRRSPSRGVLRVDYEPVTIARDYVAGGAVAISVLTEPTFFDGALAHLGEVRAAVAVPLLRKDFIVCEYQLLEAKAEGADAVLLIVAALEPRTLRELMRQAHALGLDALVEVHTVEELQIAVDVGADIVGVNNRNLRTLRVDRAASETIAAHLTPGIVAVSESGLKTADDLRRLARLGYRAFLMGERFMTEARPGEALRDLIEAATGAPA